MFLGKEETMAAHVLNERQAVLNKRLEDAGWGLFFIMIGILWLVPDAVVPQATWIIGAGLIMLGVNLFRSLYGIPMNGFSTTLGVLALGAGAASLAGIHLPVVPLLIIALGIAIIVRPFVTAQP